MPQLGVLLFRNLSKLVRILPIFALALTSMVGCEDPDIDELDELVDAEDVEDRSYLEEWPWCGNGKVEEGEDCDSGLWPKYKECTVFCTFPE